VPKNIKGLGKTTPKSWENNSKDWQTFRVVNPNIFLIFFVGIIQLY
jgi:hypothetical protein